MTDPLTRRSVLAMMAGPAVPSAERSILLGGPVFLKSDDPRELAREHKRLGYRAAFCPKVDTADTARIREIQKAYAAENVVIAEVGAWVNMMDPEPEKRAANFRYVAGRLALAEAIGALCCVDIAGSMNPKVWYGPHPGNMSAEFFEATVHNCQRLIDEVKPRRTKFCLEMMGWSIPDGPASYLRLIKAIDRKAFGVHMDVCNGINSPDRYYRNAAFIEECFRRLGPWVVSCHAKDLEWVPEMNVHFVEVVPGRGAVDYRTYLREISRLPAAAPLMLEHLKTAEEYAEGAGYIRKTGREIGLSFA